MLLKDSIEDTKELQMALALTQGLTTPDPAGAIRSSILAGASSLQCLRLTCFYSGWDSLELPYTAIGLLNDVLLDLTELKVLSLWTRMVFYDELVVLGSRIRSHPRLRRLILWGINTTQDEGDLNKHMDSLMCHWRETQDLARLEGLEIGMMADSRDLPAQPRGYYTFNSGTMEWLQGGPGDALDYRLA
jgi:hypothetical protein